MVTHLLLLELGPVLLVIDHEALGSLWVTHLAMYVDVYVKVWCIGRLDETIVVSSRR